jgi:hypothetical protein
MPAMTNMARQPTSGMKIEPSSVVAGRPHTTIIAINASHLPREAGGTNSVSDE